MSTYRYRNSSEDSGSSRSRYRSRESRGSPTRELQGYPPQISNSAEATQPYVLRAGRRMRCRIHRRDGLQDQYPPPVQYQPTRRRSHSGPRRRRRGHRHRRSPSRSRSRSDRPAVYFVFPVDAPVPAGASGPKSGPQAPWFPAACHPPLAPLWPYPAPATPAVYPDVMRLPLQLVLNGQARQQDSPVAQNCPMPDRVDKAVPATPCPTPCRLSESENDVEERRPVKTAPGDTTPEQECGVRAPGVSTDSNGSIVINIHAQPRDPEASKRLVRTGPKAESAPAAESPSDSEGEHVGPLPTRFHRRVREAEGARGAVTRQPAHAARPRQTLVPLSRAGLTPEDLRLCELQECRDRLWRRRMATQHVPTPPPPPPPPPPVPPLRRLAQSSRWVAERRKLMEHAARMRMLSPPPPSPPSPPPEPRRRVDAQTQVQTVVQLEEKPVSASAVCDTCSHTLLSEAARPSLSSFTSSSSAPDIRDALLKKADPTAVGCNLSGAIATDVFERWARSNLVYFPAAVLHAHACAQAQAQSQTASAAPSLRQAQLCHSYTQFPCDDSAKAPEQGVQLDPPEKELVGRKPNTTSVAVLAHMQTPKVDLTKKRTSVKLAFGKEPTEYARKCFRPDLSKAKFGGGGGLASGHDSVGDGRRQRVTASPAASYWRRACRPRAQIRLHFTPPDRRNWLPLPLEAPQRFQAQSTQTVLRRQGGGNLPGLAFLQRRCFVNDN